ncbi:putative transcription factor interactor and regulator Znf-B family [Helianthus annuus]|nr:putative transcription factor interactor and regulator Znf-B family [Helianthus annuus]
MLTWHTTLLFSDVDNDLALSSPPLSATTHRHLHRPPPLPYPPTPSSSPPTTTAISTTTTYHRHLHLCARCDVEVHAANEPASKHQMLLLNTPSDKLPPCDICQEKTTFIFCVEDRALFCRDCDHEPIHSADNLAAKHQRFLATRIRVALGFGCSGVGE